jgi:hypothetical protein
LKLTVTLTAPSPFYSLRIEGKAAYSSLSGYLGDNIEPRSISGTGFSLEKPLFLSAIKCLAIQRLEQ